MGNQKCNCFVCSSIKNVAFVRMAESLKKQELETPEVFDVPSSERLTFPYNAELYSEDVVEYWLLRQSMAIVSSKKLLTNIFEVGKDSVCKEQEEGFYKAADLGWIKINDPKGEWEWM